MDSVLTIYQDWRNYKISNDRTVLNKAYQTAFTALRNNKSDLYMYFCCIFLGIEKGDFDKAADLLDGLSPYKKYFKNNEPMHYAYYLYLNSLAELRCNKYRNGKKYLQLLEDYSVSREGNGYDLLLASLKLANHEYEIGRAHV